MMEHTALSAARYSVARRLTSLLGSYDEDKRNWGAAAHDPEAALRLADSLERRATSVITGIALLRHEANAALEARKGDSPQ